MSEATFRPPSTDQESNRDWSGWVKVISGESAGGYNKWDDDVLFWGTGPVYAFVRIFYDELGLHTYAPDGKQGPRIFPPASDYPTDIIALLMWIFICSVVGSIVGFVWRKKSKKAEANGTPLNTQKYRKPIIAAAILMGLVIVAAEVRNAMRKSFRKTNYALLMAAKEGDIEAVKKYLDDGAEINVMARASGQKIEGWWGEFNSLHTATQSNNDELVKLLIARGADVNVLANRGSTALSYAVSNGNVERRPPLHAAVKAPKNREELVELLILKGANVNQLSLPKYGDTALHDAVQRIDNIEVIRLLLAKGADVNEKGLGSSSAIEHALDGMKQCQRDLDRAKPGDKEKQQNRLDKMTEIVELLRKHGGKE
jgi:ankyrin repeat protein